MISDEQAAVQAQPKILDVNGYQLAALEWNPSGKRKVLASHGWLDNAATFNRLAPLLVDCHVLALDLAGHGQSDHKPMQATYNVWDDLTDLLAAADVMAWSDLHLLGHSRGAIISLLLAAAKPERIASLVMLDGLLPKPVSHADTAGQLGQFLDDFFKSKKKQQRGYESIEQAVKVRCRAIGMSEESARPIVERGLIAREGRWYWRTDPRLLNASAVKMTDEHNRALLDSLNTASLLFSASEGIGAFDYFADILADFPKLKPLAVEGSHHFHLEAPATIAAEAINAFYKRL